MKKRRTAERITALLLSFILLTAEFGGTGLTVMAAEPVVSGEETAVSDNASVSSDESTVSENEAEEGSVSSDEADGDAVSDNETEDESVSSNDAADDEASSADEENGSEEDAVSEDTGAEEDDNDIDENEDEDILADGEYVPAEKPANLWIGMPGGTVDMVKYGQTLKDGNGGTMTYDASTYTLTMKDFHISGYHKISGAEAYGIYCPGSLNIVVEGDCVIDGNAGSDMSVIEGIHVTKNLNIKASTSSLGGTLTINMGGKAKNNASGINCNQTITVQNSISGYLFVSATGSDSVYESYGIRAGAGINAKSGSLVGQGGTVTSNSRASYGINSKGTVDITGASVSATGGNVSGTSTVKSYGMYHSGTLNLSSGSLTVKNTAVNGDTFSYSCALEVTKAIKVTGGELRAVSSKAGNSASSYGVKCTESFTVTGGTLDISSGDAAGASSIATDAGTFTMSGGKLTTLSAAAKNESYGLRLTDKNQIETKITGGTITAKAGKASSSFGVKVNNYLTLNGGKMTAQGYTESISAAKPRSSSDPSIKAPVFEGALDYDGSESVRKPDYDNNAHWKYVVLDATTALVKLDSWKYGDTPGTPSVYNLNRYGESGTQVSEYKYKIPGSRGGYTTSTKQPSDAGKNYYVVAVLANGAEGESAFEIYPRSIKDVSISVTAPEYNGTEQSAEFTLKYKNYTLVINKDYIIKSGDTATNVEEKTASIAGGGNFTGSTSYSWSLKKAVPKQSMFHIRRVSRRNGVAYSELPHNNTFEYDGTAKSCAKPLFKSPYSGETTGIHVYYAKQSGAKFKTKSEVIAAMKEEAPVEVGTYLVVFTLEEQRNIAATAEDDYIEYGTLTIIKGKNPLSVRDISAGVNGRSVDLGAAVMSSAGSLSYEIEGEALGCSIKGSTLTTGNTAGTVIVKVSDTGNDNYESGTGSFIVNIKDMKFETMSITQKSITYGEELPDAIPSPYTWKIEPVAQYTGLLLDGSSYSSSEKPEKVGLYMVTLTGETDDTVYTGSAEFSIAQKEVTISGIKVLDKIYDGTDEAEFDTSAMSLSGIIPGEDAELNIGGVFADASAGKNKDVNIIETWFEGADAANYVAGEISDTVKAEIKPRPVTVTAKDQDLAVGATVASGTEYAVLEGGVYAHSLSSVKITGDTSAKTESGKLVPSEAKIMDGSSADVTSNYSIAYVNGTLRVAGRSIEDAVVEVGGSYCYSGEEIIPKDADISVSLGDDVLKKGIDYKISLSDNVNSGMAVIIAEGMGNYSGKTEGSFIIEPRTVTDPDIEVAPASYTGAAAEPHVSVTDDNGYVINPAEYSLVYSNNIKVSDEAVVTVVDKEGGNYTVSGSAKFAIKKGAQKSLEDIIRNVGSKTKEISVPLSSAVPAEMGTVSRYDIYDEEITTGSVIVDDAAIGSDGILKLQIHGGNAGDAIIQSVLITGQNFDCVICVRVRLNDLADPEYTAPQAKELEYTGKAQALLKAGSVSRGGTMEYSSDGYEWSTSVPEGTESGYYTVYWRITETEEINGVDPTPISVYIKGMSYKLTVQNGSGSGSYEAGESVVIVADAPASGKVFDKWSSDDDILFTDPFAATTSFSMPSKAVTVKATYKADEKPQPVLTKAPVPRDMKYDYNSQVLVEKGTASGGTLYYALGDTNKKAPEESRYKVSVPVGKDPGYYYVWYYIKGDLSHGNTAPACITAVIKKADGSMPDAPKGEDVPDPVIDPGYRDSAFCGVPAIDSTTVELHLVKGQKFNMPEKGWKSDKSKVIKISKSGALTVKKTTGITDPVTLSHDGRLDIKVYVTQPHFSDKSLKMEAGESRSCGFVSEDIKLPVFYSSASPDVATVDQSGTVKAVSKGTAVITAYVNAKAYTCKIKVSESEAAAERTLHLSKGSKKTVNIKGLKKVEWESSEASVVSVSKKNKLKAEAVGTAELSTVYDGKTYIIHVTVEDPVFITEGIRGSKNKYSVSMKVADVKQLDLKAPGFDKPDTRQLAFKSSKPSVAFIDEQGRLIAIGKGKTKLTAKINGKNVTLSVTVK